MKLSQLKKVTYEEIKNKQYEKLRETMGEDIELYFKRKRTVYRLSGDGDGQQIS